jgi:hypothetical protein
VFAYDRCIVAFSNAGLPSLFLEGNESFARSLVRALAEAHLVEAALPVQLVPQAILGRPGAATASEDDRVAGTTRPAENVTRCTIEVERESESK